MTSFGAIVMLSGEWPLKTLNFLKKTLKREPNYAKINPENPENGNTFLPDTLL